MLGFLAEINHYIQKIIIKISNRISIEINEDNSKLTKSK